jgi:hypothetical protein
VLDPGGDVHRLAEDIAPFESDLAQADRHADDQALRLGQLGIVLSKPILHRHPAEH